MQPLSTLVDVFLVAIYTEYSSNTLTNLTSACTFSLTLSMYTLHTVTHHCGASSRHVVLVIVAVCTKVHAAGHTRERSLLSSSQSALIPCLLSRNLNKNTFVKLSMYKFLSPYYSYKQPRPTQWGNYSHIYLILERGWCQPLVDGAEICR